MTKKNIVIAGGGFAGVSALERLDRHRPAIGKDYDIILIDKRDCFEFLPMLPDVAGGWLKPERLRISLAELAHKHRCKFIKGEIKALDLKKQRFNVDDSSINYDYAIISSGSETNFYNNQNAEKACFKLDNVDNALAIKDELLKRIKSPDTINAVVIGGGYTGIEIATNMRFLLSSAKAKFRLYIIEKSEEMLTMVPEWIRAYVRNQLQNAQIEIICRDSLKEHDGKDAILESGFRIKNAFCVWAAGVKTPQFVETLDLAKERTRVKVDARLYVADSGYNNIFIAGDAASFTEKATGRPLRMAVMFSVGQGKIAAENIINSIVKKPVLEYNPVDLGYLVPMATGTAPGIVLGKNVRGFSGYALHYLMCAHRSAFRNKAGIIKDMLWKKKGA